MIDTQKNGSENVFFLLPAFVSTFISVVIGSEVIKKIQIRL